jgi:hypothetical protein
MPLLSPSSEDNSINHSATAFTARTPESGLNAFFAALPSFLWPSNDPQFVNSSGWQGGEVTVFDHTGNTEGEWIDISNYPSTQIAVRNDHLSIPDTNHFSLPSAGLSLENSTNGDDRTAQAPLPPATKRTRQQRKPVLIGPNPYGRKGKRRCELCRTKRKRVHFPLPGPNNCSANTKICLSLVLFAKRAVSHVQPKLGEARENR